jgi:hypothetical protein
VRPEARQSVASQVQAGRLDGTALPRGLILSNKGLKT